VFRHIKAILKLQENNCTTCSTFKFPAYEKPDVVASKCSRNSLVYFRRFLLPWHVIYEFIPGRKTVNKERYNGVLRRLRDAVSRKRPQKWKTKQFLLRDNAPAHRTVLVMDFSLRTLQSSPPKLLNKILQYTPKSHILSSQRLSLQQ